MSIEDLLQAILSGTASQRTETRPSRIQQDPLAEMLQGILGGAQPSRTQQTGGGWTTYWVASLAKDQRQVVLSSLQS
ncbi:MAG: hypothetical protein ACUVR2_06480 [Anaerolineae bacterium]